MAEEGAGSTSATSDPTSPPTVPTLPFSPDAFMDIKLDNRQIALLAAGLSALLASNLCLNMAQDHVKYWKRDREQRAIMAILFMVPLFAVESYLGLADMPGSEVAITVFESVRACYEAYVVSEFLVLLFSYLDISTKRDAPVPDTVKGRVLHHSFPLTLLLGQEMIVDRRSLNTLYLLSRQFVFVRPVFSLFQCALILLKLYHVSFVPWLFLFVFNVSVYLAFYSLLLFYHAFEGELKRHNPLAKFLCVKGVVFLVFWQELAIRLLVSYGVIHAGHIPFEVRQVEEATQNFLVCIEMGLAAFLFRYAFSAAEYEHLPEEVARPREQKAQAQPTQGRQASVAPTTKQGGPSDAKKDK